MTYFDQGQLVSTATPATSNSTSNAITSSGDAGAYVAFPGLAPPGTVLLEAALNVLPSLDACAAACRREDACNTFAYCAGNSSSNGGGSDSSSGGSGSSSGGSGSGGQAGGCTSAALNVSAPPGGCQLVQQRMSEPGTGRPAVLQAAAGLTGGALPGACAARPPGTSNK